MTKFLLSFIIFVLCSYILITKTLDEPRSLTYIPSNTPIAQDNVESISLDNEIKVSEILVSDMANLKHLSETKKYEIANHIVEMSHQYDISPLLVYSFLKVESNINNNVKHSIVYPKALKKKVQAVGMGGIVWEFWADELRINTSVQTKADLNQWEKNIEATAFVLSYIQKNMKMHSKANSRIENVAIWYYGLYDVFYVEKISHNYNKLL